MGNKTQIVPGSCLQNFSQSDLKIRLFPALAASWNHLFPFLHFPEPHFAGAVRVSSAAAAPLQPLGLTPGNGDRGAAGTGAAEANHPICV